MWRKENILPENRVFQSVSGGIEPERSHTFFDGNV